MNSRRANSVCHPINSLNVKRRAVLKGMLAMPIALASVPILSEQATGTNGLPATVVDIDIKPGSYPNSINCAAKGLIPVAVLGSETFDVTCVDVQSVRFGSEQVLDPDFSGSGATPAHNGHIEDVNDDGYDDLVLHFESRFETGNTVGALIADLNDGSSFYGTDSVRILGNCD